MENLRKEWREAEFKEGVEREGKRAREGEGEGERQEYQ